MGAPAESESVTHAVHVRYFAGARAAAGIAEETVRVTPTGTGEVRAEDVIEAITALHGEKLARIVPSCSYLLNGMAVRDRSISVPERAEFDVLPPFAGG